MTTNTLNQVGMVNTEMLNDITEDGQVILSKQLFSVEIDKCDSTVCLPEF